MASILPVRSFPALFVLLGVLGGCGDSGGTPAADASTTDGNTSNVDAGQDACVPRTCQANQCGELPDGCDGRLTCSDCADAGNSAGDAGTLAVTADARSTLVSGSVTLSGVPFQCPGACGITFTETTRKTQVHTVAECEFTDIGFTFSTHLYPGTYDVSAADEGNIFGTVGRVVVQDEAISDVRLEAYLITVSGQILVNHSPFTLSGCTSGDALRKTSRLTWTDVHTGEAHSFDVDCGDAGGSSEWKYTAMLPPGTYQVDLDPVRRDVASAGFPDAPVRVVDKIEIGKTPLMRTLDLDVAIGTLTGSVTHNGQPIAEACDTFAYPRVTLTDSHNPATRLSLDVACPAGNWSFSDDWVYAGTYVVSYGEGDDGLPLTSELEVLAGSNTLVIDEVELKGNVTFNGVAPSTDNEASLAISDPTGKLSRDAYASCTAEGCSFDEFLPTGSYTVKLWHPDAHGYLPLATTLRVEGAQENLSWDFSGVHISGAIQRNQMPVVGTTCRQGSDAATVLLKHLETQLEYPLPVTCDTSKGWMFAGVVPAGKYRAEIRADYAGSPFAAAPKLLASELTIQEDGSSYTLNAPSKVTLSAEVRLNGQPVSYDSLRSGADACSGWQFSFESASEKSTTPVALTCRSGKLRIEAMLYQATYALRAGPTKGAVLRDPLLLPMVSDYVVDPALVLTQDRSDLSFDLQSRVLDLELRHDGQPITDSTCTLRRYPGSDEFDFSYAVFTSLTTGGSSTHTLRCDGTRWSVTVPLYPDAYSVDILPGPSSSLADPGAFRAFERLVIE